MPFDLGRWIEAQKQNGFASFQGATVTGSIPLRQALINSLLGEMVAQKAADKIEQLHLQVINGQISVYIKPAVSFIPAQQFLFQVVQGHAVFPDAPRWQLKLVTRGFFEAIKIVMLQQLATSLFRLPNWLSIKGELIEIDWLRFLSEAKQETIAQHLASLSLQPRADALVLEFRIQVK